MCPCFFIYVFFNLMPCRGKRGFLVKWHERKRLNAKLQFFSNISFFLKLHGYIVYLKFHHMPLSFFMYMYAFFNLMLCRGKRGFPIFLLISHSIHIKISWNFMVILFIKSFTVCPCVFFIYVFFKLMLCHRKRGGLCKFSILTNMSFSFCQNLMELHSYTVL